MDERRTKTALADGELKMRKPKRDWFVFKPSDDEATVHASKRLAVRDAQCRGCTEARPKKFGVGQYRLFGCSGYEYWIISKPVMEANYLQLMESAYADAA